MKCGFLIFIAIIFFSCSVNTSNNTTNNSNDTTLLNKLPEFLIYGELTPENYIDQDDSITKDFGFVVKRIAGCEITENERIKAIKQNKKSLEIMNERYGENWRQNFEKQTNFKLYISLN